MVPPGFFRCSGVTDSGGRWGGLPLDLRPPQLVPELPRVLLWYRLQEVLQGVIRPQGGSPMAPSNGIAPMAPCLRTHPARPRRCPTPPWRRPRRSRPAGAPPPSKGSGDAPGGQAHHGVRISGGPLVARWPTRSPRVPVTPSQEPGGSSGPRLRCCRSWSALLLTWGRPVAGPKRGPGAGQIKSDRPLRVTGSPPLP